MTQTTHGFREDSKAEEPEKEKEKEKERETAKEKADQKGDVGKETMLMSNMVKSQDTTEQYDTE